MDEEYDVFAACKPMVISTLTIDEIVTTRGRELRLGGPGYHMSWISTAYRLSHLDIVSYVNTRDENVFASAIKERGSNPVLIPIRHPTARIVLDYTREMRRISFKHFPIDIGEEIVEEARERRPGLLVISPVYGELNVETLKELTGLPQWSVLDLQGYTRTMAPEDLISVFPRRVVDIIHLSSDDIPQRQFDALLDEIAGLARHSLLYTLGPEGAVLLDSSGNPRLRAKPKEVSSSPGVGCGDVFSLSYGLFLCGTWEPRKAFIEALMTSMYYALKPPDIHQYILG
ncbi:MAG: hypothetical protein F7B59_07900 [Desulfurococcales archaeon]|nr:hypothetical protein [Desulfurococcales archaeon]